MINNNYGNMEIKRELYVLNYKLQYGVRHWQSAWLHGAMCNGDITNRSRNARIKK